ncbi:hypothetical protein amb1011 [Paramagnetospirillum magneticum AMB-1]|uniref:Uncharacterized protein n=1 Tax=Paramagnetospirillum magneticum (strain ATCC 700264 / AMB-1) TaxID=342108 RepID=Q2W8L0_PARM1|nr:hypothetical protein amb1011 [Paramagnetospirillum magneticum AMB-1]
MPLSRSKLRRSSPPASGPTAAFSVRTSSTQHMPVMRKARDLPGRGGWSAAVGRTADAPPPQHLLVQQDLASDMTRTPSTRSVIALDNHPIQVEHGPWSHYRVNGKS